MRSRAAAVAIAVALAVGDAGAFAGDAWATFPGADGRLAFFAQVGCGRYTEPGDRCLGQAFSALMTVGPAGRGPSTLGRCPGPECVGAIGRHPVWSPDGTRLAVELAPTGQAGTSEIAILSDHGTLVRAATVPRSDGHPVSWLPDGRRVAVVAGDRLFTVAAGGGPARAVSGLRGSRTWSVRGEVAVAHRRGIYVWRPETGRRRLILRAGRRYGYGSPDWSPIGRRIAVRRTDLSTGLSVIVTVAALGGRSRVVVRGPSPSCLVGDPVWSPAGTRMAFASTCLEPADVASIYAVRPDGSRLRRLFDATSLTRPPAGAEAYVGETVSWQARP